MRWLSPSCPPRGRTRRHGEDADPRSRPRLAPGLGRATSARFVGRSSSSRCTRNPLPSRPRRPPRSRSLRSPCRTGHELRLRGVWWRRCRAGPGPRRLAGIPHVAAPGAANTRARWQPAVDLGESTACRVVPQRDGALQARRRRYARSVSPDARRRPPRAPGGLWLRHLRLVLAVRHQHGQRMCLRRCRGLRTHPDGRARLPR